MSRIKSFGVLAGAAIALASSAGLASDAQNAQRAELLSDAQERTSLRAAAANAYHENGHFGLTDSAGNNSINVGLFGQYRHFFNFGDNVEDRGNDDFAHGGQLSRVNMFFFGNVGSPDFEYFIQVGASGVGSFGMDDFDFGEGDGPGQNSSSIELLDFLGTYNFENGMFFQFGRGRPLQSFEAAPAQYQQAMERSLAYEILGTDRQEFFGLGFGQDAIEGMVYFSDGFRSAGTDIGAFNSADWAFGARINGYFMGTRDQFSGNYPGQSFVGQSAFRGTPEGLRAGVGGLWQSGGDTGFTADVDAFFVDGDIEYRGDGFRAAGHFYYASIDPEGGSSTDHFAVALRAGYFVDEQVEVYGGFDALYFDDDLGIEEDDQHIARIGVNWFPIERSYAVRVTGEFFYAFDDTVGLIQANDALTGSGLGGAGLSRHNILGSDDGSEYGFGIQASLLN